jgi:hypothetical protein
MAAPDWVLTQVRPYPMQGALIDLPQILLVHPSRARVFALLEDSIRRACGLYEGKRLVERTATWFEYEPPNGAGTFAVVRPRAWL